MNDDVTKRIVRESILHTSDNFTQELMQRVERKNALRKEFSKAFLVGCGCCALILILVAAGSSLSALLPLPVPAFYTKLLGITTTFCLLNQLIAIREALAKI